MEGCVHGERCPRCASQKLEPNHHVGAETVSPPSPSSLCVGFELGVTQGAFQPGSMDSAGGDLKVHLDIDIGRTSMVVGAF